MERKRLILDIALGTAILIVGGIAWSQSGEITELEESLARMEARVVAIEGPRVVVEHEPSDDEADDEDGQVTSPTGAPRTAAVAVAPTSPNIGAAAPAAPAADLDENPALKTQLRELIADEQKLLQEERWQQRSQRREQRLREQVAAIAEKTGMDGATTEQVTDLLVVEQAEAGEIFRQAREDFGWEEAREKVDALRKETDAKVKDLLEEGEYAEYQTMRREDADRWGRGGRGRGGERTADPTRRRNRENTR